MSLAISIASELKEELEDIKMLRDLFGKALLHFLVNRGGPTGNETEFIVVSYKFTQYAIHAKHDDDTDLMLMKLGRASVPGGTRGWISKDGMMTFDLSVINSESRILVT